MPLCCYHLDQGAYWLIYALMQLFVYNYSNKETGRLPVEWKKRKKRKD